MEQLVPHVERALHKALESDLTGLRLLCEWAFLELAYPHSVARPTKIARKVGVRKANIRQRIDGQAVKSLIDGTRLIVMYEDGKSGPNYVEPLAPIVERLRVAGIEIEQPDVPDIAIEPEPTGEMTAADIEDPPPQGPPPTPSDEAPEFDEVVPHIEEQKMLLQFVREIPEPSERVFIKRRVAQYMNDFPELTMAPDEMLLTSLMMVELQMYRLQQAIGKGEDVPPDRIGSVQSHCQQICTALGITRAQRLKYGERGGASVADLVADIDNLEQEALKKFHDDLIEEEPIVAVALERVERELAPGEAEAVLQKEFGIEINTRTGEFMEQQVEQASEDT